MASEASEANEASKASNFFTMRLLMACGHEEEHKFRVDEDDKAIQETAVYLESFPCRECEFARQEAKLEYLLKWLDLSPLGDLE